MELNASQGWGSDVASKEHGASADRGLGTQLPGWPGTSHGHFSKFVSSCTNELLMG